jgi:hypothetical protein
LIKFEPGQDYLLPRYNDTGYYIPEELHWVSQTSWHMDGLATKLYIPPSVNEDTVTLTYESDQLSISFTIDQLEDLDTLIDVDYGNAVSFQAIRCELWADSPTRGHLAGRWGRDDNGQGIFYGRWMNSNGRLVGAIKGVWGIDDAGNQVFIGKWIDRSGKFRGFVKGLWYQDPLSDNVRASGRFRGMIFNAERLRIGYLQRSVPGYDIQCRTSADRVSSRALHDEDGPPRWIFRGQMVRRRMFRLSLNKA